MDRNPFILFDDSTTSMAFDGNLQTTPQDGDNSPAPEAACFGRVGLLEFGPFTLPELAELTAAHSLPDDLEIRINADELWWSWPRIVAGAGTDDASPLHSLGDWFTRVEDTVAGPLTIVDVAELLLSGRLPATAAVQIGDGAWRPVTELLVPVEAPEAAPESAESLPQPAPGLAGEPIPVAPEITAAERKKVDLEAWLTTTMPQRPVTVVISARPAARPLEDVIATAMSRVAAEMDQAARTLSYPWLWGTFAAIVVIGFVFLRFQPRGPDELELTSLRKLKSALEAIRAVRASQPDQATWDEFGQALQQDLDVLKAELAGAKRADTPIKESLYWALEYRLPRILAEGRLQACPSEQQFQNNLNEAERHLHPGAR